MNNLVDVHCHLFGGLDDGPTTWDESLEMCRLALADGTVAIAATAHQNDQWPNNSPEAILTATNKLKEILRSAKIPLFVAPVGEVMITSNTLDDWQAGKLLSYAHQCRYLLIELPSGIFLDLRWLITELVQLGIRPVLAHPERHPEFLHSPGVIEDLILRGCVVQVTAASILQQRYREVRTALQQWARRGLIHTIGSDGHSPTHRRPGISAAYQQLAEWTDWATADRICSTNGMALLEGLPLEIPHPKMPSKRRWFGRR